MPALLSDPDAPMAMATPMNWSVAEPAVGILVSSMPAIRAMRCLWRADGDTSAGSHMHSTPKSCSAAGHIQLYDIKDAKTAARFTPLDVDEAKLADNDSEEHLVVGSNPPSRAAFAPGTTAQTSGGTSLAGLGNISRTTELQVSYGQR